MGFIAAAQKTLAKNEGLKATYILATDPGKKHYGTVTEVGHSAEVHGEEGSTVLIKASIDKGDLSDLRPGATVDHFDYSALDLLTARAWAFETINFTRP